MPNHLDAELDNISLNAWRVNYIERQRYYNKLINLKRQCFVRINMLMSGWKGSWSRVVSSFPVASGLSKACTHTREGKRRFSSNTWETHDTMSPRHSQARQKFHLDFNRDGLNSKENAFRCPFSLAELPRQRKQGSAAKWEAPSISPHVPGELLTTGIILTQTPTTGSIFHSGTRTAHSPHLCHIGRMLDDTDTE